MLSWPIDNANILYFVFGAVALGYLSAWWSTRRTKYLAIAGAAIGLIVLLFLLTVFVVTERGQIKLNLQAMAKATEKHDANAVVKHVAKTFRYNGKDRDLEDLRRRIASAAKANKVAKVELSIARVVVTGDRAEAVFNCHVTARDDLSIGITANSKFVREDGEWKMTELDLFFANTNNPLRIPSFD